MLLRGEGHTPSGVHSTPYPSLRTPSQLYHSGYTLKTPNPQSNLSMKSSPEHFNHWEELPLVSHPWPMRKQTRCSTNPVQIPGPPQCARWTACNAFTARTSRVRTDLAGNQSYCPIYRPACTGPLLPFPSIPPQWAISFGLNIQQTDKQLLAIRRPASRPSPELSNAI